MTISALPSAPLATSSVIRLAPTPGPVAVAELLAALAQAPRLPPFAPPALAVLDALHRRLLTDPAARRHPELQALGFWLRPAALSRLAAGFQTGLPPQTVAVPRGLVFHVPPANVDTLFVYSWVPALLAGNANLIRLSERSSSAVARLLLTMIGELLATPEAAAVAAGTALVQYPRDDTITAALSLAADARLLWGGDAVVRHLRTLPIAPHALDLAFPDRVSWAALAAEPYLALASGQRDRLAEALFNDIFSFDQQACASPRLLLWCGPAAATAAAGADLYPRIAAEAAARSYQPGPGARLDRLAAWHRAVLDFPVAEMRGERDGALTVLRLARLDPADREALGVSGAGVLFEAHITDLADCVPMVTRRVQTLGHFGFAPATLTALAHALTGRGIDRMVPLGQALSFETIWDGIDLPRALTRLVVTTPGGFMTA